MASDADAASDLHDNIHGVTRTTKRRAVPQPSPRWHQFWCKPDADIALDQDGFLVGNLGARHRLVPSGLRTLEQLEDKRCLVLLGELGVGKSEALYAEEDRLRAASVDVLRVDRAATRDESRTQRRLFENPRFLTWASGDGELHFLLDSYFRTTVKALVVGWFWLWWWGVEACSTRGYRPVVSITGV